MVTLGGGVGQTVADQNTPSTPTARDGRSRSTTPATKTWQLGPAAIEDRGYHSTAVLLPDARVSSAGDEKHPLEPGGGWALTDTAEIYSPPYLFKGPRPRIVSAPNEPALGRRVRSSGRVKRPRQVGSPGRAEHHHARRRLHPAGGQAGGSSTYEGGIRLAAPPSAQTSHRPVTTCSSSSTRASPRSPPG